MPICRTGLTRMGDIWANGDVYVLYTKGLSKIHGATVIFNVLPASGKEISSDRNVVSPRILI